MRAPHFRMSFERIAPSPARNPSPFVRRVFLNPIPAQPQT
jgi:hypothetical protein